MSVNHSIVGSGFDSLIRSLKRVFHKGKGGEGMAPAPSTDDGSEVLLSNGWKTIASGLVVDEDIRTADPSMPLVDADIVKADQVQEHTVDNGVSVDGVVCKDGSVTAETVEATAGVVTDTISESTDAVGVTIEGVLLKDSNVNGEILTANDFLSANEVHEKDENEGVLVDGVLCKDGNVSAAIGTLYTGLVTDSISERTTDSGVTVDGLLLKDGAIVQDAWIPLSFENSWGDYGGDYQVAEYLLDKQGFVHLRGVIAGGSFPAVAATLPAGFRPGAWESFQVANAESTATRLALVQIKDDGSIYVQDANDDSFIPLSGIIFYAEG